MPDLCEVDIVRIVVHSSFHTHTRLCKHASGEPADYIREAVAGGSSFLGISDHCPYPDDSVWPGSRMAVSSVPEYLGLLEKAKAASPIPVRWGFECEWHPAFGSWYRDVLKGEYGAEYLVYGSHWVPDGGEFYYIPDVTDEPLLKRYVALTLEALSTGLYDCFAHPDLFLAGFTRMTAEVKAACRDIIDAAIAAKIPMEVNGLGLLRPQIQGDNGMRSPYPVREFWEMAADAGAVIICNSDAHQPEEAIEGARRAERFALDIGITPVEASTALGFA